MRLAMYLGDLETVRAARRLTVKPRVGFGSVTVEAYSVCAWLHACMRICACAGMGVCPNAEAANHFNY